MSSTTKLLIKKSGAKIEEGKSSKFSRSDPTKRSERWRAITALEVEFGGELHMTPSHRQQLELNSHESKACNVE